MRLAPDDPFSHFAFSWVHDQQWQRKRALRAIKEAMRLNPAEPDYYAQEAYLHLRGQRWKAAMRTARKGLQLDPEHLDCGRAKVLTLILTGRSDAAQSLMREILARYPEEAALHADLGWLTLLEGDRDKANEHFLEALRIDPTSDWARKGLERAQGPHRERGVVLLVSIVLMTVMILHIIPKSERRPLPNEPVRTFPLQPELPKLRIIEFKNGEKKVVVVDPGGFARPEGESIPPVEKVPVRRE